MSLQFAKAPYSVPWKTWLLSRLFPAEFSTAHQKHLGADIQAAFDETYEVDGFNISDGSYTLASDCVDPKSVPRYGNSGSAFYLIRFLFSVFAVLFGLPNRATTIVYLDQSVEHAPLMYFKQIGLNLIGGWDSDPKISLEKKIWQWFSLPVKIAVILPIKLLVIPIKIVINNFKIYLEWLPLVLATLTARAVGAYRSTRLGGASLPEKYEWENSPGKSFGWSIVVVLFKLPHLILGTLYFVFRLVALIGRALLSPEKSIRMAINYGREVKIQFGESPAGIWFGHLMSNTIAAVAALISLAMTVTLWTLLLPLGFTFVSAHAGVLVQAFNWFTQLPAVTTVISWLSQVPYLTASLSAAHGALTSFGLLISSVIGPTISTLGALIGLKISVGVMMSCTSIALIGAIAAPPLTKLGDFLSNTWASWTHSGPFTALFSLCIPSRRATKTADEQIALEENQPLVEDSGRENTVSVSSEAASIGGNYSESVGTAEKTAKQVEKSNAYQRTAQRGVLEPTKGFGELYAEEQLRYTAV